MVTATNCQKTSSAGGAEHEQREPYDYPTAKGVEEVMASAL
jgi:hypothetical protein